MNKIRHFKNINRQLDGHFHLRPGGISPHPRKKYMYKVKKILLNLVFFYVHIFIKNSLSALRRVCDIGQKKYLHQVALSPSKGYNTRYLCKHSQFNPQRIEDVTRGKARVRYFFLFSEFFCLTFHYFNSYMLMYIVCCCCCYLPVLVSVLGGRGGANKYS